MSAPISLLRPDRLRTVERPFAAIPCRFLYDGLFPRLSPEGRQLYFLLNLAADRRGLVLYPHSRLMKFLGFSEDQWENGLSDLLYHDLVARSATLIQVLSLPLDPTSSRVPPHSCSITPPDRNVTEIQTPTPNSQATGIPIELIQILELLSNGSSL